MRTQSDELSIQKQQTEKFSQEIITASKNAHDNEQKINSVTTQVTENMNKIQKYWDTQVNETVDTISLFQHNLNENIDIVSEGLEKINEQFELSIF